MVYTEILRRGNKKYYYRVKSIKYHGKVKKVRKYLGVNLEETKLKALEDKADIKLDESLNILLKKHEVKELDNIKKIYLKGVKINFSNKYETFLSQFTYNTNAIEGNTLTLRETSLILFDNITPKGKSLREINEVLNHKKAFDYVLNYKKDVDKKFICKIQEITVENTLKDELKNYIGKYRDIQVYIHGAEFIPPKSKDAKKDMARLLRWYNSNKNKIHPLIVSAYFHAAFEAIHPFVDGNGRTGRLLLNFILHKNGFPMVNILNKDRLYYYDCLDSGRKGNLRKFVKFLFDLIKSSKLYL